MTFAETSLLQRPSRAGGPPAIEWSRPPFQPLESGAQSRRPEPLANLEHTALGRRAAPALVFGRFRFVVHSRELSADGTPIPLGSRALEVLSVLIEADGELVTKDELLSRVWPTTIVEENNLQFQISSLRKALGPDRDLIRTVSGRGYRFVGEVALEAPRARPELNKLAVDQPEATIIEYRAPLSAGNLPAPASDIVGREAHLLDLSALVTANRLVTLVGAGGIGKTRLAIELARRLQPTFDGVWVAELGALSDPGLVPGAVASALGLGGGAISPARLAASLGARPQILVLDNCEHVVDAAASIAETLLHACASLRVIATSREPLRAEGEWVYRAPPLDVPSEGEEDLELVLQHSAARLFIERMRAAAPATPPLGPSAATATTKICRRLDGIPLAIELAAARAAAVGVEALAARLDDRLSLLTDGRRTAPARHQTLRATLDWSHELLSEPERVVMRRLAVFAGDFTMEAAALAAGFGEVSAAKAVQCLESLVAKSLVAADLGAPEPRYRLLETMRAYAIDKLSESGEFETATKIARKFEICLEILSRPHPEHLRINKIILQTGSKDKP
jgi:predicted ATPase/DNA-binding winged helix-turn-helix (wHTH) protein